MSTVLLLPTVKYTVGEEYTPNYDPRTITYFIPVINWSFLTVQIKGWTDNTYDLVHSHTAFFRDYNDDFTVIGIDFLINRSNGKIKIANVKSIDISSNGAYIHQIESIDGIGLHGVIS